MLHVNDIHHVIASDLTLQAPFAFKLKIEANGKTLGVENLTGVKLALIPADENAPSAESLADAMQRSLKQRHLDLQLIGDFQPASGQGWSGQTRMFRVGLGTQNEKRLLLTGIGLQEANRHFALLLEVPEALFAERLMFYRRFAEQRLRFVPETKAVNPAQPSASLSLAPMEVSANVEQPQPINMTAASAKVAPGQNAPALYIKSGSANNSSIASPAKASTEDIESQAESERLREAALGQRTLNVSIALNFVLSALVRNSEIHWAVILAMACALLFYALSGVLRFGTAFECGKNAKLGLMLASSIPLVSLLLWLVLSVSTTRKLRAAGYQVGLLGVRP